MTMATTMEAITMAALVVSARTVYSLAFFITARPSQTKSGQYLMAWQRDHVEDSTGQSQQPGGKSWKNSLNSLKALPAWGYRVSGRSWGSDRLISSRWNHFLPEQTRTEKKKKNPDAPKDPRPIAKTWWQLRWIAAENRYGFWRHYWKCAVQFSSTDR
jgi:hypothetical protein